MCSIRHDTGDIWNPEPAKGPISGVPVQRTREVGLYELLEAFFNVLGSAVFTHRRT